MVILLLLAFLTTFMYVFVQASIAPNRDALERARADGAVWDAAQSGLDIALRSNAQLARMFLIVTLVVGAFILALYHRQAFARQLSSIGTMRSLGFTARQIATGYVQVTVKIAGVGSLAGLGGGLVASRVPIDSYRAAYPGIDVVQGLHLDSIGWALGPVLVVWSLTTVACFRVQTHQDPGILL